MKSKSRRNVFEGHNPRYDYHQKDLEKIRLREVGICRNLRGAKPRAVPKHTTAGQGVWVWAGGKAIQKKQNNVKTDAIAISWSTMLLLFTLSTTIPQMGYNSMLPLSKYEAAVLASDSVSPNRPSKILLNMHGLSQINYRLESRTYGARWMKGCQIEPHKTFNPTYLSETVTISSQSPRQISYARPDDIAKLEHLFQFEPSPVCYLLYGLSLGHADN